MKHEYSGAFLNYLMREGEMTLEEINSMTRNEIFEEVLNLNGYLGNVYNLKRIIQDVYGINLDTWEEDHDGQ